MKIIDEKITKNIPNLYSQDGLGKDATVYLVLKSKNGWRWYITEYDGSDTFFGYVEGYYDEWGYISKSELNKMISKNEICITPTEKAKLQNYIESH